MPKKAKNTQADVLGSAAMPFTDRVVREPERQRITGISRTSWWMGEREGRFPRRRMLGPGSVGWLLSELQAFLHALPKSGEDTQVSG